MNASIMFTHTIFIKWHHHIQVIHDTDKQIPMRDGLGMFISYRFNKYLLIIIQQCKRLMDFCMYPCV